VAESEYRQAIVRAAGEEVLRVFAAGGGCPLCHYSDHDNDGGERHEDECPLRPLDEVPL
jgi:hypothetical protein